MVEMFIGCEKATDIEPAWRGVMWELYLYLHVYVEAAKPALVMRQPEHLEPHQPHTLISTFATSRQRTD
jgi:hypothetical protein